MRRGFRSAGKNVRHLLSEEVDGAEDRRSAAG